MLLATTHRAYEVLYIHVETRMHSIRTYVSKTFCLHPENSAEGFAIHWWCTGVGVERPVYENVLIA